MLFICCPKHHCPPESEQSAEDTEDKSEPDQVAKEKDEDEMEAEADVSEFTGLDVEAAGGR